MSFVVDRRDTGQASKGDFFLAAVQLSRGMNKTRVRKQIRYPCPRVAKSSILYSLLVELVPSDTVLDGNSEHGSLLLRAGVRAPRAGYRDRDRLELRPKVYRLIIAWESAAAPLARADDPSAWAGG